MVAGFQPGENQNPLPRAAGRFDHHPPLAAPGAASRSTAALVEPAVGAAMAAPVARTPPTPASASRPKPGVREPPPGMPPLRPLCPPRTAQRRHIRPGAKWTPGGLNPDEPQLLCRTRKKKFRCGPSSNPRGVIQCFFRWQRLFAAPRRFFTPALRRKSFSTPYIYRDELPILITHFWLSTFDSSCLLLVSSPSSH